MTDTKHKNYEILNLIGYGMAKFGTRFINQFGFKTKSAFYEYVIQSGVAETVGAVKNRQDLFDPFFDNGRKGWWQKGNAYIHRKQLIDSLFGEYDVKNYVQIVKLYLKQHFKISDILPSLVSPIIKSKFKQLQQTGKEAELFFIENYREVIEFSDGKLEDARLFGDGYDFQIQIVSKYFLVEVKGIRQDYGGFRMTENEFVKAKEYKMDFGLVVVSNLDDVPKMTAVFDPLESIVLDKKTAMQQQVSYHSKATKW